MKAVCVYISTILVLYAAIMGTGIASQVNGAELSAEEPGFTLASFSFTDLYGKQANLSDAAHIISNFDIVLVRGTFDKITEPVIDDTVAYCEKQGFKYAYIFAPQNDSTAQVSVVFYRTDLVYPIQWYWYKNAEFGLFNKNLLVVRFAHNGAIFDFTVISWQADAENPSREIDALPTVVREVKNKIGNENDIIILADPSHDCNPILSNESLHPLEDQGYIVLFYDDAFPNTSGQCPPIRFIIASYSNTLFWEAPGLFIIEPKPIEGLSPSQVFPNTAGFSTFIIVTDEETEENTETKAGCFFSSTTTSN